MMAPMVWTMDREKERLVRVNARGTLLEGNLVLPRAASGIVLFAHGSGSSRHSPRNRMVAEVFQRSGLATLLVDLLTAEEHEEDEATRRLRFDIPLLGGRLVGVVDWILAERELSALPIGLFGASTGAAAAIIAAAERRDAILAVVSRGGRPDLAGVYLGRIVAPTLLIVGGDDEVVMKLNEAAWKRIRARNELVVIPGATHLFEEPGAMAEVSRLATRWFTSHLIHRPYGRATA